MGIQGLLPLLKSIQKPCHLRKFAGQTVGIDAYGWLHRGTVACAIDLALDKPTTKYVDFAMNRVRMLIHFGITPYMVFDGDYLPSKACTEKDRAARRRESKSLGLQFLKAGKSAQAQQELQKAVDVTPEMAGLLIAELKRVGVQYVVAPYEADSQLAYLEKKGIIQAILSEDSDLLVFGARCLLTKLDQYGECVMIRRDDFTACREISLVGWTDADFRKMAILSGCDYLASVTNMGLKTAYRLLRKHKTVERAIRAVQFDGKFRVPQNYLEDFTQAEMTFLYQWVYCPVAKAVVSFSEPKDDVDPRGLEFIGSFVEAKVAAGVANGSLNPHTKEALVLPVIPRNSRSSFPLVRAKTTPAPSELKKNHSIDSFFKPNRTPLAELDPNMFTPSPAQQQVMRQGHGALWTASPSPSVTAVLSAQRPSQRLYPNTVQRPTSTPALQRSNTAHPTGNHPMSAPTRRLASADDRSAKRPRLCSSGSMPIATDGDYKANQRSKFFTARRKSAKASSDLWSDDSLENALLDISDYQTNRSGARKNEAISIFADDGVVSQDETLHPAADEDTTQSTTATFGSSSRENSMPHDCSPPSSVERIAASPVNKQRKGLARFVYATEKKEETTCVPVSPNVKLKQDVLADEEMGITYVTRTQPSKHVSDVPDVVESQPPSLQPTECPPSSTLAVCGSEDLLISESEAEDPHSPVRGQAEFNVTQYAFVPL